MFVEGHTRSLTGSTSSSSVNDASEEFDRLKFGFDERLESPAAISVISMDGSDCESCIWDLIYFSGLCGKQNGVWIGMDNELGITNFLGVGVGRFNWSGERNEKFLGSLKNSRICNEMK